METGWFQLKLMKRDPKELDIRDIADMLGRIEDLLFAKHKRKQRPHASFNLIDGCTELIITTRIEEIRTVQDFLAAVSEHKNLSILDPARVEALEYFQSWLTENDEIGEFRTSESPGQSTLTLSPNTNYYLTPPEWVDAEIYLYGTITNMGGTANPNIHLLTQEHGRVLVKTPVSVLANEKDNRLYKEAGILVQTKQNLSTGEIMTHADFIEFAEYSRTYDEAYIQQCVANGAPHWADVDDSIVWLHSIRGTHEAKDSLP